MNLITMNSYNENVNVNADSDKIPTDTIMDSADDSASSSKEDKEGD